MSSLQALASPGQVSSLRTRLGVLTLLLLCGIQFMDVADTSIVNVALPSIQHDLHFSQQNLQWVASGYLLTYGGFLLLGGRAADLLGRRRVLVAGLIWFAVCSLAGGLAHSQGLLISARIAQGVGAAIMAPAALSILTTTFTRGQGPQHRARHLGRHLRDRRSHGRLPRRRTGRGARLALGPVRQPADRRGVAAGQLPTAARRPDKRVPRSRV